MSAYEPPPNPPGSPLDNDGNAGRMVRGEEDDEANYCVCSSNSDSDSNDDDYSKVQKNDNFFSLDNLGISSSLPEQVEGNGETSQYHHYTDHGMDGLAISEAKRHNFHDYLKESGLLGAIAKSVLALYDAEELPPSHEVGQFIASILGYSMTIREDIAQAKTQNSVMSTRLKKAQAENDWLKRRLDEYESSETPIEILDDPALQPVLEPVKLNRRHHRRKPAPQQRAEEVKVNSGEKNQKLNADNVQQDGNHVQT